MKILNINVCVYLNEITAEKYLRLVLKSYNNHANVFHTTTGVLRHRYKP